MSALHDDLAELVTAEDFLDYFQIPYEQRMVDRCRLHILQRAHDYLATALDGNDGKPNTGDADGAETQLRERMRAMLEQAYRDFITSHPLEERVFKVLREVPARERLTFVPLEAVARARTRSDEPRR
ncbi:MAG: nitrogenase-stabilizing/protective protein NifW [Hyphomicrobium sp.]